MKTGYGSLEKRDGAYYWRSDYGREAVEIVPAADLDRAVELLKLVRQDAADHSPYGVIERRITAFLADPERER